MKFYFFSDTNNDNSIVSWISSIPIPILVSEFKIHRYRYRYSYRSLRFIDTDTDTWYRSPKYRSTIPIPIVSPIPDVILHNIPCYCCYPHHSCYPRYRCHHSLWIELVVSKETTFETTRKKYQIELVALKKYFVVIVVILDVLVALVFHFVPAIIIHFRLELWF